jgi:dephospho-CoA kinase
MVRDGLTREQATQRVSSQMSQAEKQKFADYLIDTSNGFEDTRRQTISVYEQLVGYTKRGKE